MKEFRRGLLATTPLAPGMAAFGLLYGVVARQVGFSPWDAWAMSLIVHAGSAQFTALGMWGTSNALPIILTTLVINLRHLLMGASLAPHLREHSQRWRALLALWMSDETYALNIAEYERGRGGYLFFFGTNVGTYLIWTSSGLIGGMLGSAIPDPTSYGLDLVFPLAFLGLLMAFLKDRIGVIVALVSAGLSLLGVLWLPGKWYVIAAGLLGSGLGLLIEELGKGKRG
jgi:4-azaleucine resistance transporter AzlC